MRDYTVVLLITAPDNPYLVDTGGYTEQVVAVSPSDAVEKAVGLRRDDDFNVQWVAVFEGHHTPASLSWV